MCTVSFVPTKQGAIISSNRDENVARGNTISPTTYVENKVKLVYPKDEKGTGTWIGYNEFNFMAVLLNGAFEKHLYKPPYKQSRGLIIPFVLSNNNPIAAIQHYNFNEIEPFTLILFGNNNLLEFRWDGKKLFTQKLSNQQCHLWNSATLYSKELEAKNRNELVDGYLNSISPKDIYQFHITKKYELQLPLDSAINNIKTVSLTQLIATPNSTKMEYYSFIESPVKKAITPSNAYEYV